jgi:ribosomal-protein-alanine N-acetyltransferase
MKPKLTISKYNLLHEADCVNIFTSNLPTYFDKDELPGLVQWLAGQNKNELAYKNTLSESFFVGHINEMLVACGGYYICKNEKRASLAWGMVHNDWHGKSIGLQLLAFRVKDIIDKYPTYSITLDTSQHTFGFFEKMNFKTVKILPNYYAQGLHRYDMIYG